MSNDGTYSLDAAYGISAEIKNHWQNIPMSMTTPVIEAFKSQKVIYVETLEQLHDQYPDTQENNISEYILPVVAIPIIRQGLAICVITLNGSEIKLTDEKRTFLELIGTMIGIVLRFTHFHNSHEHSRPARSELEGQPLTLREQEIQQLMRLGKTNRQIAQELGYSESTIRQDAVSLPTPVGGWYAFEITPQNKSTPTISVSVSSSQIRSPLIINS
jgi:hypothetical protein